MGPARDLVIGNVVHFESRDHECPAIVVATAESIYEPDDPAVGQPIPPVLDDRNERVHLIIFNPIPGADPARLVLNVPHDEDMIPETYHHPFECVE